MKRLPYINIFFFTVYIIFLVSCSNEKLPSINIIKKGLIGWKIKEPCNIIYSDAEKVDELSGRNKCFYDWIKQK